jgi:hypothetical protein
MSLILAAGIVVLIAYSVAALRIYARERAPRIVHCPASGEVVSVRLAAGRAALGLQRRNALQVTRCTLWPAQKSCAQGCLNEIERLPDHCVFRQVLAHWYRDKQCAFCRRPIPEHHRGDLQPSLLAPDGRILMWSEIPPARLYEVLAAYRPVCASCDVAETFRQRHADWVVERPPRRPDPSAPPRLERENTVAAPVRRS